MQGHPLAHVIFVAGRQQHAAIQDFSHAFPFGSIGKVEGYWCKTGPAIRIERIAVAPPGDADKNVIPSPQTVRA
jgi:hypothetical protein